MANTFTVTVDGNDKYVLNGDTATKPVFYVGETYTFDMSDSTNSGHPLEIHSDQSGTTYNTTSTSGTAGQSGSTVTFTPGASGDAYLYCTNHGIGMGSHYNSLTVVGSDTIFTKTDAAGSGTVTISISGALDSGDYTGSISKSDIKYVYIGTTVTSIGDGAFSSCTALQNVTIGDSVTSIGQIAFYDCSTLQSVIIGDSVETIGNQAFESCSALQSVTIPDSVTSIGTQAFLSCSALQSVTIGDGVTDIGVEAFKDCTNASFTTITIPSSVTDLRSNVFSGCTSLTKVYVSSTNNINLSPITESTSTTVGGSGTLAVYYEDSLVVTKTDDSVVNIQTDAATDLVDTIYTNEGLVKTDLKGVVINGTLLTSIDDEAFKDCTNLESVTISNSMQTIGNRAFHSCTSLTSITFSGTSQVTTIGYAVFSGCSVLNNVTIPDSVETMGDHVFYNCSALANMSFPDNASFINIGESAFEGTDLTSVTIPNSVQTIEDRAFYSCSELTTVVIGTDVQSIGNRAFHSCTKFASITFSGTSLTTVGYAVFSGCSVLNNVTIPDSVETMGDHVFYNCSALTTISLPNNSSFINIGESAFEGTDLTSVTIPNSVQRIETQAFKDCTNVSFTTITIPSSVDDLGTNVFNGCTSLTKVYVSSTNNINSSPITESTSTTVGGSGTLAVYYEDSLVVTKASHSGGGVVNIQTDEATDLVDTIYTNEGLIKTDLKGVVINGTLLTSIGNSAFSYCSALESVTIGNSVQTIGETAFFNCQKLESITIPDSVTSIGDEAFLNCFDLESVTFDGTSIVASIGSDAFHSCTALQSVSIPDSVTSIGDEAFFACNALQSVTIGNSVTSIGSQVFYGCTAVQSLTIGNSVTSIGYYAFAGCAMQSLTIPDSVTTLGEYAFSGCSALESVTIPDSVTSIGNYAFSFCSALQSVTIGDSVTSIGNSAFHSCSTLQSVTIGNSVTSIGNEVFYECSALNNVTIPTSVISIGWGVFYSCIALDSLTIPDNVTSIGESIFFGCSALETVTFSGTSTITNIGNNALKSCGELTTFTVPDSVTSIGNNAFQSCSKLASLTIGNSVNTIGTSAFESCILLTSITIPDSVTSIGQRVFRGCSELNTLTIGNSVTTIDDEAFYNCGKIQSVAIPNSVTSIGDSAFYGCNDMNSLTLPDSVTTIDSNAFSNSGIATLFVKNTNGLGPLTPGVQTIGGKSVTVYYINVSPVFDSSPITTINKNAAYNYTPVISYVNGVDNATVSAIIPTASQSWLSFNGTTLSGTPTNSDVGNHSIIIEANDSTIGETTTQSFTIEVTNNAPTFTSTPVTDATQGAEYLYRITTSDIDDENGLILDSLTAPTKPEWLRLDEGIDGGLLVGTPSNSDVGSHNVVLSITDGISTTTQSFTIVVANMNDAPTFTSSVITSATQGQLYSYTVETNDIDGDAVTVTATIKPNWLSFDGTTLSGTPDNNAATEVAVGGDVGRHDVLLTASDGTLTATQQFVIVVANVNDIPTFTSAAPTTAVEDVAYSYTVTTNDIDGDVVTVTATNKPDWLSFNNNILSGTPSNSDVGSHHVELTASDGALSTTQSFTLTVIENDAPTFTSTPVTSATQGQLYSYIVITNDVDTGDNITLTVTTKPDWLSLNQTTSLLITEKSISLFHQTNALSLNQTTKILSGTPTNDDVGSHNVVLTATDSNGASTTQSFTIVVANVNDPPTFTSAAPTSATQGQLYSYTVTTNDVDGDTVTVTATTKPSWLSFDGTTLSGTPNNSDVGNNNIVLTATDGALTTTQSFTILVVDVNDPPTFTSIPLTTANQELLYSYTVTTNDIDGDNVTVTATKKPNWLSFDGTTLSGTPVNGILGKYDIELTASDGSESVTQSFSIIVSKPICFKAGTRILCLKNGKEQYIRIGQLKEGDKVKTLNHGYKKIVDIRKGNYKLNGLMDMGMYRMKKQGNMIAKLEMTGLHCVLVDKNDPKYADDIKRQGNLNNPKFSLDGKFRLRARESHLFEQMEEKTYTIFSFALEDEDQDQYGIWANGALVETTSRKMLEVSNMLKFGRLMRRNANKSK